MEGNAKQEVAEKLRSSSSVLVTVSNNPSVDQLASALGLSLMLTKLGKHTTTVFSGEIPNTMEFLDPEKTFDKTVDGLRDFIISLDKEKADKLRYKVEDNVVKIYITPYKAKITDKDLEFSQGDFNVDLVVALGVHKRNDLDNAITSHGRILHDATIVTINAGGSGDGSLGAVDWSDANASCLAEMLVSISEALEGGILDKQMSTAFLTGIVAETERFKNEKTTPKVMTMSAQLMAAGANQQLIAQNLQIQAPEPKPEEPKDTSNKGPKAEDKAEEDDDFAQEDRTMAIDRDEDTSNEPQEKPKHEPKQEPETEPEAKPMEGEIDLEEEGSLEDIEKAVHAQHRKLNEEGRVERLDEEDPAIQQLEDELSHDSSTNLLDLEGKLKSFDPDAVEQPEAEDRGPIGNAKSMAATSYDPDDKPMMGGTFNATSQEAHEASEADRRNDLNHEILSHGQPGGTAHAQDIQPSGEVRAQDMPSSEELMHDLAEARRAVEAAMDDSQPGGAAPLQALNANPMGMDNGESMDLNLGNNMPPAPQMNAPQGPSPMPAPQMPQQQYGSMPQGNPMFNLPPQQQQQYPQQNGQMPMNGNSGPQMPQGSPPPMPPQAPPPMPPFN